MGPIARKHAKSLWIGMGTQGQRCKSQVMQNASEIGNLGGALWWPCSRPLGFRRDTGELRTRNEQGQVVVGFVPYWAPSEATGPVERVPFE